MKKITTTVALFLALCFFLITLLIPLVSATEDSWTTLEPMPTARDGLGVAVVDGKIYAIGGVVNAINEMYDPATNTWTTKTPMPTPRGRFGIAVVDNKIYCIGGTSGFREFHGTNEVYDPATDTWETKASMPTSRGGLCACVVNDKIYCIGGTVPMYYYTGLTGSNQIYDPKTDSWTSGERMPNFEGFGEALITSAVVDKKIYMICRSFNQMYDPQTNNWSSRAMMPVPSKFFVAGATSGEFAPKKIHVLDNRNHQIYDPETDTWTNGTAMPTPRWLFGIAVVNDELYSIGGYNGNYDGNYSTKIFDVNEKYTPAGYIPEFPSWIILPFLIMFTVVVIVFKKKVFRKIHD